MFLVAAVIAGAIIGLLLVFLLLLVDQIFVREDFYDHMTSQPFRICFLLIRSCNFN